MDDQEREQDWFKGNLVIEGSVIKELVKFEEKYPGFTIIDREQFSDARLLVSYRGNDHVEGLCR